MKKSLTLFPVMLVFLAVIGQSKSDRVVGSACEACDIMYDGIPDNPAPECNIAGPDGPGERMIITGTLYRKDGHTPAAGVILYVYHTDAKGLYSAGPGKGNGNRHGHLRGWIKTGPDGKYVLKSIRPASYPGRTAAAHIHPLIKEPGLTLYWIDEFVFDDDPLVNDKYKSLMKLRGGNGIIHLAKNKDGVWVGKRDITLGLNIPGY